MRRTLAAVIDTVCSLAVVLTSNATVTYIDSVMKPKETFKGYTDKEDSWPSEHSHKGPVWLAVSVWHFTLTDEGWKTATNPKTPRDGVCRASPAHKFSPNGSVV
jgi:hypothetical protein